MNDALTPLGNMGQNLFDPPDVAGWDLGRSWFSTGSMLARMNFASALAANQKFNLATAARGNASSPDELLSFVLDALRTPSVGADTRAALLAYVDRFFALYADNVHRHGTPALPQRWFQALRDEFGADCDVLTVESPTGKPLSSVLSFYFRGELLAYYAGDDESARDLACNDFKYWELMRHACARGCRIFDYGRSKAGTGPFSFKKNWGFEPMPLSYEYRLFKRDEIPQNNPLNPKYRAFIAMWRRLPISVANRLPDSPHGSLFSPLHLHTGQTTSDRIGVSLMTSRCCPWQVVQVLSSHHKSTAIESLAGSIAPTLPAMCANCSRMLGSAFTRPSISFCSCSSQLSESACACFACSFALPGKVLA